MLHCMVSNSDGLVVLPAAIDELSLSLALGFAFGNRAGLGLSFSFSLGFRYSFWFRLCLTISITITTGIRAFRNLRCRLDGLAFRLGSVSVVP